MSAQCATFKRALKDCKALFCSCWPLKALLHNNPHSPVHTHSYDASSFSLRCAFSPSYVRSHDRCTFESSSGRVNTVTEISQMYSPPFLWSGFVSVKFWRNKLESITGGPEGCFLFCELPSAFLKFELCCALMCRAVRPRGRFSGAPLCTLRKGN